MNNIVQDDFYLEEDTQKDKYLIFNLGNEFYGIEIKNVIEIIGMQPITPVPELPEYINGIINLRGKIIPVMDVRTRFKMPKIEYDDRTCIIVVDVDDISIGLIVDIVAEVITIEEENIVLPPENTRKYNRYIKGIGKLNNEVRLLLDCHKLLTEDELESLESVEEALE
ncbi:MAG: purine-binding chemotaxis protein CheW [Clostridiales bacterium]|nr:purine-binding chemotaxis protein CheW [Clostridiales bacterium]